jgi:hypothetical protein
MAERKIFGKMQNSFEITRIFAWDKFMPPWDKFIPLSDASLLINEIVLAFQAAVSKGTTAAAIASTRRPWGFGSTIFEDAPEGRLKVAITCQQVFKELNAEMLDDSME